LGGLLLHIALARVVVEGVIHAWIDFHLVSYSSSDQRLLQRILAGIWFYWILWTVVKPAHDEEMSML
jgi:hypothetical protein